MIWGGPHLRKPPYVLDMYALIFNFPRKWNNTKCEGTWICWGSKNEDLATYDIPMSEWPFWPKKSLWNHHHDRFEGSTDFVESPDQLTEWPWETHRSDYQGSKHQTSIQSIHVLVLSMSLQWKYMKIKTYQNVRPASQPSDPCYPCLGFFFAIWSIQWKFQKAMDHIPSSFHVV